MALRWARMADRAQDDVVQSMFAAAAEAARCAEGERKAAQHLQACLRTASAAGSHFAWRLATESVQSAIRGVAGRRILDRLLVEAEKQRRVAFFNRCATDIQRWCVFFTLFFSRALDIQQASASSWRGYWSRKKAEGALVGEEGLRFDFRARKRALAEISRRNEALMQRPSSVPELPPIRQPTLSR